jgi:hypothetical protein
VEKLSLRSVVIKIEETPDALDRLTLRVGPHCLKASSTVIASMHTTVSLMVGRNFISSIHLGQELILSLEEEKLEEGWETVCDKCGDLSNSEPGLRCGWENKPLEGDSVFPKPVACPGTYREKSWFLAEKRACPLFVSDGAWTPYPLCTMCGLPETAHRQGL